MKLLIFVILLSPWFLSSLLFPFNPIFYQSLLKPFFTPPGIIFIVTWPILFITITFSFYLILKHDKLNKNYLFYYLLNYILNQSFNLFFFYLNNLTLTLYNIFLLLASTVILYFQTYKINKKYSYLLIPYVLWICFATILFTSIYFLNQPM